MTTDIQNFRLYKKALEYFGDLREARLRSSEELEQLRQQTDALFVLNPYDFDCPEETAFWHVIQDRCPDIEEYSKSMRKNIRRSLKEYTYQPITIDTMLQDGYRVYCEAFARYGTQPPLSEEEYKADINQKAAGDRHYEFWGGYHIETGELAMWEEMIVFPGYAVMSAEKLSNRFTQGNPTYGLNFALIEEYIGKRKLDFIDAGARTLSGHSQVQDFLCDKFMFRKGYCRLQLHMAPRLRFAVKVLYPLRKLSLLPGKVKQLLRLYQYSKESEKK